jgi:hypothetical protein
MAEVVLSDEAFRAWHAQVKAESEKKNSGSFPTPEYEDVKWVGCESGKNIFVRLLGGPPGLEGYVRQPHDSLMLMVSDIKDDSGKKMHIKFPIKTGQQASDHIIHRLYDAGAAVEWIPNKATGKRDKVLKYGAKYPELIEAITKTGFKQDKDGISYTYATGLKGQQVVVFNVIDRGDSWCADNKHTKLLSKQVDVVAQDDGTVRYYPRTGVPSHGFVQRLGELIGKYGNYEKYDIAIKKMGEKTNPYELKNASNYKDKGVLEELQNDTGDEVEIDKIISGPLTTAEIKYERYDITKLMQPTSYQKLLKRIPSVFKLTDACLGTHFYEELESLAKKEREAWDALNEAKEETQAVAETKAIKEAVTEVQNETPAVETESQVHNARKRIGPAITLSSEKIALLKGWSKLSDREKAGIVDVVEKDGKVVGVKYTPELSKEDFLECTDCNVSAPESYTTACPVCGVDF